MASTDEQALACLAQRVQAADWSGVVGLMEAHPAHAALQAKACEALCKEWREEADALGRTGRLAGAVDAILAAMRAHVQTSACC